ncbi:MAG: DUF433 domain-containing protein [Halobaculum sp.]
MSDTAETSTTPRIVATANVLGGDPRIEGTRVGVHGIYRRYAKLNDEPSAIAADYDLSLAEVHAALAYAFANTEEMRAIERRTAELREEGGTITPKG